MRTNSKVMFAGALTTVTAAALIAPAFAGTGGSDYAGILFGESDLYCNASLESVIKTDAATGQPLEGATFTLAAQSEAAVKAYTEAEVEAGLPSEDQALWVYTFNNNIDTAFTATDFGAAYLAAQIQMEEGVNQTGDSDETGVWVDGTQYVTTEVVTFPVDMRGVAGNASAESAAMRQWVTMAGDTLPENTTSVADFYDSANARLDALGAVVYGADDDEDPPPAPYDPAAPTVPGAPVAEPLAGTASEAGALAEYTKQYNLVMNLLEAVDAAGYTVDYTAMTYDPTLFSADSQDWEAFTAAYAAVIGEDLDEGESSWSFGLTPPTYDLVAAAVGQEAVTAAMVAANTAVGATNPAEGVSDAEGMVYFQAFGRANDGTLTQAPSTDCAHLEVEVTEIEAPAGYIMDPEAQFTTPSNFEPVPAVGDDNDMPRVGAALVFTNTLDIPGGTPETPDNPRFESGL